MPQRDQNPVTGSERPQNHGSESEANGIGQLYIVKYKYQGVVMLTEYLDP